MIGVLLIANAMALNWKPSQCIAATIRPEQIRFSPDSKIVSYLRVCSDSAFSLPDSPPKKHWVEFRWRDIQGGNWKSQIIASAGPELGGLGLQGKVHYCISSSSRFAVVSHNSRLLVIDLQSKGQQRQISAESEGSPLCVSDDLVMFATVRGTEKVFWKQDLQDIKGKPSRIISIDNAAGVLHFISPCGRYAIIAPTISRRWLLVNLRTQKTTWFGDTLPEHPVVSWKSNGAAAICASELVRLSKFEAIQVLADQAKMSDLTEEFNQLRHIRRHEVFSEHRLWYAMCPIWATGDEYFVLENICGLVTPDPWSFVDVKKAFSKIEGADHGEVYELHNLTVPGWFVADMEHSIGEAPANRHRAISMRLDRLIRLNRAGSTQSSLCDESPELGFVSANGEWVAWFDHEKREVRTERAAAPLAPNWGTVGINGRNHVKN